MWPKPQYFTEGNITCNVNPLILKWQIIGAASNSKLLQKSIENYKLLTFPWTNFSSNGNDRSYGSNIVNEIILNSASDTEVLNSDMIENYTLSMTNNCSIMHVNSPQIWGIIRSLETISQIIEYNFTTMQYYIKNAPFYIDDYPRFKHRGLLIDVGLHFQSISAIKRQISALAYNKMNILHFHATESSSMPIESKIYPNLAKYGSYNPKNGIYSQDDLNELIYYAKQYGIRIILELDMPGHSYAWGLGYPELICNCSDMYPLEVLYWHSAFDPTKDYVYNFMDNFISEMVNIFEDDYIHVGGDEVVDFSFNCWNNTPSIQQYMDQYNVTLYDLYSMFETNTFNILHKYNKKPIVWDDVFIEIPNVLSNKQTIIQIWRENQTIIEDILKSGYYAIQSSQNEYYLNLGFDYGGEYVKAWDIYRNDPLPLSYNLTNIERERFLGCEIAIWGEDVDEYNIDQRVWFRGSIFAERVWTESDKINTYNLNDTTRRVIQHRCRLLQRGIHASGYQDDDDYPFPMRNWNEQCQLYLPLYIPVY